MLLPRNERQAFEEERDVEIAGHRIGATSLLHQEAIGHDAIS